MKPDINTIKIHDNLHLIEQFVGELIVSPKHLLKKWSEITNQTPAVKLGYIGQHLASLITGVPGTGSGARGDDLVDGSEVKSCNKVDQADKCLDCGARVMRYQKVCPNPKCRSVHIERKDDSKWLFSIRSDKELKQYLEMDRVVLILMDYPNFDKDDFKDIRISCFEIYPKDPRMKVFRELLTYHYNYIYKKKVEKKQKTNPMNFHPFSIQFYKCNPIQTFECIVKDIDGDARILIEKDKYIDPATDRDSTFATLPMPSSLLREGEWAKMLESTNFNREVRPLLKEDMSESEFRRLSTKEKVEKLPYIDENLRNHVPLRDIVSVHQKTAYVRSKDRL